MATINILSALEDNLLGGNAVNTAGCFIFARFSDTFAAWAPYYSTLVYKAVRNSVEGNGVLGNVSDADRFIE